MKRLTLGLAAVFLAALLGVDALAETKTSETSRKLSAEEAVRLSQNAIGRKLANYRLTDSSGKPLATNDLRGKPLVISIVYAACVTVCPVMTQHLLEAVEEANGVIGPDRFNVLTLGFDATNDTPERMEQFAINNDIRLANWHFASSDKDTIIAMLRNLGFSYASVAGGFDHVAQTTIVDVDGTIYRHVYGDAFPIQVFMEPLKDTVYGRKRDLTVDGLIDRFRFFCTNYDPTTGRYITSYAETVGGIVLGGLSLLLAAFLIRREWLKTSHSV